MLSLENAIRNRIYNLAKERNITINKVSTLSGLPHTTLLSFMNNDTHDPRISTLLHLCEAFNITLNEFFNDALFDEVQAE
ncbi:MAG: helix-turn-helix transcriptional regulator [Clostridia bacterium]|nr:helix-turn-helix transcriptional regulator [Clostridia bacterium]MCI9275860.1 helix-turn-helix transcriptional regulator [Clostridia bacterium]